MRICDQPTGCNADTPPWECWSRGWKVPYPPVSSTSLEFLSSKAIQIHRNCEAIFWEAERSQTRILTIQNFPNNRNHLERVTHWKSPLARASNGPPYSQGGTGKYGLESDQTFVHSASLLMKMNGEHRGTGAGTGGITDISNCGQKISCVLDLDYFWIKIWNI